MPAREIVVLEGLEAVRRRPALFLGEASFGRLVESLLLNVATDDPAPTAVRLIVWGGGIASVAFDGEPLSIRPYPAGAEVAHPDLYRWFMQLFAQRPFRNLPYGAAVANALSARLVVTTVHGGVCWRAVFSRGGLVSLLAEAPADAERLGSSWLTFQPDATVVPGELGFAEAQAICARVAAAAPGVPVVALDRGAEMPEW